MQIAFWRFCFQVIKCTDKPHKNKVEMPIKAVDGHGPVRMHQSAGFSQCHDPAKKTEILDKKVKDISYSGRNHGNEKSKVHGNTAQLEWKIPPVIGSAIFYIIDKSLFI